jgi:GPH family glycoside/pentoside/hexuronide:cation symporter
MGVQSFMAQIAYLISPWFLWFMQWPVLFDNQVQGASWLAIAVAVVVIGLGVLPAIFLRERYQDAERNNPVPADADKSQTPRKTLVENFREFIDGFLLTLKFRPFLQLCFATFLVFNGFMLVSSFQFYVIIYYVFGGDQSQGAVYAGYAGTIGAVSTFCVIVFVTWLATKIGKRRAFFISTGISVLGYVLKWCCYDPDTPMLLLLPAPLIAFGLGGLFPLVSSMIADVCDLDELKTGERREGMYGSIFWWVVKLGMAVALAAGGIMLNATGFDVDLGGAQGEDTVRMMRLFDAFVPALCSLAAIWIISGFPITEESSHEVRQELELRKSD